MVGEFKNIVKKEITQVLNNQISLTKQIQDYNSDVKNQIKEENIKMILNNLQNS